MNDTAQIDAKRFIKLFWPIFILCIMTIVVMRERMGIQAQGTTFKKETFEKRMCTLYSERRTFIKNT